MRTTVTLDDDVMNALQQLRRDEGLPTSAALNKLVRQGLAVGPGPTRSFRQQTSNMGRPLVPLDSVGEALDLLEGDDHR